jgi:hypothetical protein
METLQQSGMRIELEWTPGHAEVQGNEIADCLAKEAAKEAQEQDTAVHTMVTKQDIITASRNSISEKWQHQWENSDRGRSYFKYHPKNATKIFHQNLYLQSSPVSDPVSFHLTTINISPIKLIVQTVYAVNQK